MLSLLYLGVFQPYFQRLKAIQGQPAGNRQRRMDMQADITHRFILLTQLDHRIMLLARLRAAAVCALVLGILLLLFAGAARSAQPLLPFFSGALLSGIALPLLLLSQVLLLLRRDMHRSLVRYLFRKGHRVEYAEFDRAGETPAVLRMRPHANPKH